MNRIKKDVIEYAIDRLNDGVGEDAYIEDLHHEIFNTDYFIIGTNHAKEWLGSEVFNVIETIKEYEQSNFGEVSTDFTDPEKLVNMYAYILGEEILYEDSYYKIVQDSDIEDTKLDSQYLRELMNSLKDSLNA